MKPNLKQSFKISKELTKTKISNQALRKKAKILSLYIFLTSKIRRFVNQLEIKSHVIQTFWEKLELKKFQITFNTEKEK